MKFKLISTVALLVILVSFTENCTKAPSTLTGQYGATGATSNMYGTGTTGYNYTSTGAYTEPTSTYTPYQQGTSTNSAYTSDQASNYNIVDSIDDNPLINKDKNGTVSSASKTGSSTLLTADNLPNLQPYVPSGSIVSDNYSLAGSFKVDQDSYLPGGLLDSFLPSKNQWRASGIAAVGSDLLVTASDASGLFKKGTVILMNGETGQDWKDLGSKWLGATYPMNYDVKGITFDADGQIYATSMKDFVYVLAQPTFTVEKFSAGIVDGIDIAVIASGTVVVATTSGLKKFSTSSSFTSSTDFGQGVAPTGGICADIVGNLYVVSSNSIKKVDSNGAVSTVINDVGAVPIDVAVSDSERIFVLTSSGIKLYSSNGSLVKTFAQGETASPVAITNSGEDIFVADAGTSYKDSKVLRYSTAN